MKFGGILYLREAAQRNHAMFNKLRANATLSGAMLSVTTKNGRHEDANYWAYLVANTFRSPREVVDLALKRELDLDVCTVRTQLEKLVGPKSPPRKPKPGLWRQIRSLFS